MWPICSSPPILYMFKDYSSQVQTWVALQVGLPETKNASLFGARRYLQLFLCLPAASAAAPLTDCIESDFVESSI